MPALPVGGGPGRVRSPALPEKGGPGAPALPAKGRPGRVRSLARARGGRGGGVGGVALRRSFVRSRVARADAGAPAVCTGKEVRKGGCKVALRRSRSLDRPATKRPSALSLDRPATHAGRPSATNPDRQVALARRPSATRLARPLVRSRVARSRARAFAAAGRTLLTPAVSRQRRWTPFGPPSS